MPERLKKRRDFLAAAKGQKAARRAFVLEAVRRRDKDETGLARLGFTVSKRTAKSAVERNRIRRRLREAARLETEDAWRPGHDYVLVGRRSALTQPFAELRSALGEALAEAAGKLGRQSGDGAQRRDR
jgi:ribonuclease P protein component